MTGKLRLIVASRNPVKLEAARGGFERSFPEAEIDAEGISVPSGVADQPMSDEETLRGATHRAAAARAAAPGADFWIGLEGGIAELPPNKSQETSRQKTGEKTDDKADGPDLLAFAWVVVHGRDGLSFRDGRARTAAFPLPPPVTALIRQGLELGEADDRIFGRTNSKAQQGAVGLLTDGLLNRAGLYEPAVVLALIPFLQPELFPVSTPD